MPDSQRKTYGQAQGTERSPTGLENRCLSRGRLAIKEETDKSRGQTMGLICLGKELRVIISIKRGGETLESFEPQR